MFFTGKGEHDLCFKILWGRLSFIWNTCCWLLLLHMMKSTHAPQGTCFLLHKSGICVRKLLSVKLILLKRIHSNNENVPLPLPSFLTNKVVLPTILWGFTGLSVLQWQKQNKTKQKQTIQNWADWYLWKDQYLLIWASECLNSYIKKYSLSQALVYLMEF